MAILECASTVYDGRGLQDGVGRGGYHGIGGSSHWHVVVYLGGVAILRGMRVRDGSPTTFRVRLTVVPDGGGQAWDAGVVDWGRGPGGQGREFESLHVQEGASQPDLLAVVFLAAADFFRFPEEEDVLPYFLVIEFL